MENLINEIVRKLYEIHYHKGDELEAVVELNQAIKVVKEVIDSYVIRDTEHPYLRILETGEEWTLGKYASRFTKLVYTDLEDICKSMTDNMYYLLDECGNWEYLNPEKVEILKTKDINYIKKIDKELKKKYKREN